MFDRFKFKLSDKARRFIQIWIKNFIILFFVMTASVIVGGLLGYFVVEMIHSFGLKPVLISLFFFWLLLLVGIIAGAKSETELDKILRKEDEVMRKMRNHD